MNEFKNELTLEHVGLIGLNEFCAHITASRGYMLASHFSQRLVIDKPDEDIIQTGLEQELSKYTFNIKMPADGRIIKIIDRHPRGMGKDSFNLNPETIVIYEKESEDISVREIDYFSLPHHASYHQYFGYEYIEREENIAKIRPNAYIAKGTVFKDSPSVKDNDSYAYGVNLNVAFMTLPSVSEDGIMISRDVLEKFKFKLYETRVVEFGSKEFPLNIYGSRDEYKSFPDIGEYIDNTRSDGLLMMLRKYEDKLLPVDMSINDVREPDFIFDRAVYARGGRGKVVDIKVICNNNKVKYLPEEMKYQLDKYAKAYVKFHQELLDTEKQLRYEHKRHHSNKLLKFTPKLHNLLVDSLAITNFKHSKQDKPLNLLYKKNPIDEYRIEFIIEYEITPTIGFKLTDQAGSKGVICKIEEPENMPIDADGNRADMVMDPTSTLSRMNVGKLFKHYVTGSTRDTRKRILEMLNVTNGVSINELAGIDITVINNVYNYLMGYYKIISPRQYEFFNSLSYEDRLTHLHDIITDRIYLYIGVDNQVSALSMVEELEKYYPQTYGPVSYVGNSGIRRTTIKPVRIAPLYIMLLENIGDNWSAVSSAKLQHYGILSPITKSEKFSLPYRSSPTRTIGVTEGRIYVGYTGMESIAEMFDRSNNPLSRKAIVWKLLDAEEPTNIPEIIDRSKISLGGSKAIQLIKHIMMVAGFSPIYEPEDI